MKLNFTVYSYQQTDLEKYSTVSASKKISNQSSAFFSSQSITIWWTNIAFINGHTHPVMLRMV